MLKNLWFNAQIEESLKENNSVKFLQWRYTMKRGLSALVDKEYDLLIVGGGIFGVCAAWDAVSRGLSVALVEKGDFACATSANSLKMIHGGIRYLQHLDLPRIRYSVRERRALLRIAPHLVHPLPTVIPTYGHGMEGKELLSAGFLFYDLIAFDRNWGVRDPGRKIPKGRFISREEILELFPGLEKHALTGAAIFSDAQVYNPPRLALSFLKSAVNAGAVVANYVEVTDFIRSEDCISGVKAKDVLTGGELEIRGKVILNTAGPWAEQLLNHVDIQVNPQRTFSRDACFIVPRPLSGKYAIAVQARTKDPDALLSRKNRHLFIAPWRGYTLIGVWHVVHKGEAGVFNVTEKELKGFIDEINVAYPSLGLKIDDVSMWNAGLVLSSKNEPGATNIRYGKRSKILDHFIENGVNGLVTLIGSRFTTARGDTSKAIDLIFNKLGRKAPKSTTDLTPIYGGNFECFEELLGAAIKQCVHNLSEDVMYALLRNYGSEYNEIIKYVDNDTSLGETIGASKVIKAEIVNAVRNDMPQRLEDVVLRRTDLATGEYPGDDALKICANLMGVEQGWDKNRVQKELEDVKATLQRICVAL